MKDFFEIAYATIEKRLCLFTGTGFSRAISDNKAPSWEELLIKLCEDQPKLSGQKELLFPSAQNSFLSLEEKAQIISIKLETNNISIKEKISDIINSIAICNDTNKIAEIKNFFSKQYFKITTTNYDKLAELIYPERKYQSITPGLPVPRSSAEIKIFHIHGSIDSPKNMVVTADDYFNFINKNNYFDRKLSTILQENIIVILGYSLGDTNLKIILNEYRIASMSLFSSSNIFFVSRDSVQNHIKDYYSHCYGIRVIDKTEINDFFHQLNNYIPIVEEKIKNNIDNIKKLIKQNKDFSFKDDFIQVEDSFYQIIASASADGVSINDKKLVNIIGKALKKKVELTRTDGAWDQYVNLANWLVYLASLIDIQPTSINDVYIEAVTHSMKNMSESLTLGYSWHAYKVWDAGWISIRHQNRKFIRENLEEESENNKNIKNIITK